MKTFSHQINTLYQFEISNLLSVEAPTMANSYLSLTNTGLYLTILCFSVSVLILYFIFKADKTQEVYMLREQ